MIKLVFANKDGVYVLLGWPTAFYPSSANQRFMVELHDRQGIKHCIYMKDILRWEDLDAEGRSENQEGSETNPSSRESVGARKGQ